MRLWQRKFIRTKTWLQFLYFLIRVQQHVKSNSKFQMSWLQSQSTNWLEFLDICLLIHISATKSNIFARIQRYNYYRLCYIFFSNLDEIIYALNNINRRFEKIPSVLVGVPTGWKPHTRTPTLQLWRPQVKLSSEKSQNPILPSRLGFLPTTIVTLTRCSTPRRQWWISRCERRALYSLHINILFTSKPQRAETERWDDRTRAALLHMCVPVPIMLKSAALRVASVTLEGPDGRNGFCATPC